jgi:hypothetical protein
VVAVHAQARQALQSGEIKPAYDFETVVAEFQHLELIQAIERAFFEVEQSIAGQAQLSQLV